MNSGDPMQHYISRHNKSSHHTHTTGKMLVLLALIGIAEACHPSPLSQPCTTRFLDAHLNMADVREATHGSISYKNCTATVTSITGGDSPQFHCSGSFESRDLSCSNEANGGLLVYQFKCEVNLFVLFKRVFLSLL